MQLRNTARGVLLYYDPYRCRRRRRRLRHHKGWLPPLLRAMLAAGHRDCPQLYVPREREKQTRARARACPSFSFAYLNGYE